MASPNASTGKPGSGALYSSLLVVLTTLVLAVLSAIYQLSNAYSPGLQQAMHLFEGLFFPTTGIYLIFMVILIATRKELNLLGKACSILTIILSALLIFSSLYPSYLSVGIFFASKLHLFSTYSAAFVFLFFGATFCAFTWFVTSDDNGSASRIPALVCGCFLLFVFAVGAALRMAYIAILPSHLFKAIGVMNSIELLTFAILLTLLAMFMGKGLQPRLKGAAVFSSVLSTALTAVAQALFLALIFQSPGPSHFAKPYTVLNALSLLSFGIVFLLFALLARSTRIREAG